MSQKSPGKRDSRRIQDLLCLREMYGITPPPQLQNFLRSEWNEGLLVYVRTGAHQHQCVTDTTRLIRDCICFCGWARHPGYIRRVWENGIIRAAKRHGGSGEAFLSRRVISVSPHLVGLNRCYLLYIHTRRPRLKRQPRMRVCCGTSYLELP